MSLRLWTAICAGAQVLAAGSALADVLGPTPAGLIALVIGALNLGLAVYKGDAKPKETVRPPV